MDIKQELAQLLSRDVEGLIASPDSLKLLKIASIVLLNGEQPRTCAKAIRHYYNQLKKIDMDAVERAEKVSQRTCKPAWSGLRFIKGNHYSDKHITDEEAIKLLNNGMLQPSDFKTLPEGYIITVKSDEEPAEKPAPKPRAKKATPKKK